MTSSKEQLHPMLALAYHLMMVTDASAAKKTQPLITRINEQLLENWSTTSALKGEVVLPHTSFSTEALPQFTPHQGGKTVHIAFSGIGGQTGDRLNQILPLVFSDYTEGKPTEFVFVGYPTSFGGKVTPEWNQHLIEVGPSLHGTAAAEVIAPKLKDHETIETVVFNGRSKGSRTAAYTLTHFPEYTEKRTLIRDHQPKDTRYLLPTVAKYLSDAGIGRIKQFFTQDFFPKQSEEAFLRQQTERLSAQEINETDNRTAVVMAVLGFSFNFKKREQFCDLPVTQQNKEIENLQKTALILDILQMKEPTPIVPDDVAITNIRGLFDFTNFSLRDLFLLKRLREAGKMMITRGRETTIFDRSMHSGIPFSERTIYSMLATVRG
jgi:hypothetical protein